MKKLLSSIFIFILLLSGCSSPDVADNVITIWSHVSPDSTEGQTYQRRVSELNQFGDGYTYEIEFIPGDAYENRINAAIKSGEMPDVIALESTIIPAYVDSDIITSLDSLSDSDLSNYTDNVIQAGTYNEELYSLTGFDVTAGLFYNVDLFKEANITPATIDKPWTFDEFYNNTKQLSEYLGKPSVKMFLDNSYWQMYAFTPFIWSNNGQVVDDDGLKVDGILNSEQNIETFEWLQKLVSEDIVTTNAPENALVSEEVAISVEGIWASHAEGMDTLNWSVMPYPTNNGILSNPIGTWGFAITTNANVDGAANAVLQLSNESTALEMAESDGLVPGHEGVAENVDFFKTEQGQILSELVQEHGHVRPQTPIYDVLADSLGDIIEGVTLNPSSEVEPIIEKTFTKIELQSKRYVE